MTAKLGSWILAILMTAAAPAAQAACDLGAGADATAAARAAQIGASLPLTYVGTFQWDGSPGVQHVTMSFSGCEVGGAVRLVGRGTYLDSGTNIDVIADVKGEAIVVVERNPRDGTGGFITAGRHRGDIAPDLSRICAVWVTDADGSTGRLRLGLTAADAEGCGAPFTS